MLLISHCGMKAVSEAVHHAVPLVCVPIFGDQGDIARRVVDKHLGVTIDRKVLTAQLLIDAVNTVLNDQRYIRRWNKQVC